MQLFDEVEPFWAYAEMGNAQGVGFNVVNAPLPVRVRVDAIYFGNNDAVDHEVQLAVYNGAADQSFGTIHVPAGAGRGVVATVEAIGLLVPGNLAGIVLAPFYQLAVRLAVAPAGVSVVYITMQGGFV